MPGATRRKRRGCEACFALYVRGRRPFAPAGTALRADANPDRMIALEIAMNRSLIAIMLGLACVAPAADQGSSPGMSGDERRIGLAELPEPAREAIQREAADSQIGDITRTTVDGRVVYEVRLTQEGADRHLQVAADGGVLPPHDRGGDMKREGREAWEETKEASNEAWNEAKETSKEAWHSTKEVTGSAWERSREALDDDGLTLANVPAEVKATLEREAAGGDITDIDVEAKGGKISYTAEVRIPDARNRVLRVDLDGTLLPNE